MLHNYNRANILFVKLYTLHFNRAVYHIRITKEKKIIPDQKGLVEPEALNINGKSKF